MTAIELRGTGRPINAVVRVPGSKSVANRALLCAALAGDGMSRVTNVPTGDDSEAMLAALRVAGCLGEDCTVRGGVFPGTASRFDAGIAGTTSRFLTAASVLSTTGIVVDGGEPLRRRPMVDLHDALRAIGAHVEELGRTGHLPVRVAAGPSTEGVVSVGGDVSSQFISALMLVAPRLPSGLVIDVRGELVSRPYVEMTAQVMRSFGAAVTIEDRQVRVAPGGYVATDYDVEPDFSAAAFPLMALAFGAGRVEIQDLLRSRLQGDSFILEIARQMGMTVSSAGDDVVVERASGSFISPVDVDLRDASDLVPAVATACTVARGTSFLRGIGFIRSKESDRLGDLAHELNAAGADVKVMDDGLEIRGGGVPSTTTRFVTHDDHRLAMAFALVAVGGGRCVIDDGSVVSKSWPEYFSAMEGLLGPAMDASSVDTE